MKNYRWLLILCVVFIIAVVCTMGWLLWQRLDAVDYETRLIQAFGSGETVTAEMDGVKTEVMVYNCEKLRSLLTITERERTRHDPDPEKQTMVIRVGERMTVTVENGDEALDEVFVTAQSGVWKRSFRIAGYDSFHWITRTAGPEGYYGPNPVIE